MLEKVLKGLDGVNFAAWLTIKKAATIAAARKSKSSFLDVKKVRLILRGEVWSIRKGSPGLDKSEGKTGKEG